MTDALDYFLRAALRWAPPILALQLLGGEWWERAVVILAIAFGFTVVEAQAKSEAPR
jgi:hypothetical protein